MDAGARGRRAPTHAANAPPPTWTNTRSSADAADALGHLPADRAAAVEAQRVLRPCTLNGTAPAATASRNRMHARVARRIVVAARTRLTIAAPSRSSARRPPGRAHGGTNTSIGHSTARGERRRGQRRVAARGDRQRRPVRRTDGPRREPQRSAARRCSRIVNRCRALWLPATLPVSSFTQTPPSAGTRARRTARRSGANGVTLKPVPATAAIAASSSRPTRVAGVVGHAVRARRTRPRRGTAPNATNGFGSSVGRSGASRRHDLRARGAGRASVALGHRHGNGVGDVDRAPHTAQRKPTTSIHAVVSPRATRALNSPIISSHTPR